MLESTKEMTGRLKKYLGNDQDNSILFSGENVSDTEFK